MKKNISDNPSFGFKAPSPSEESREKRDKNAAYNQQRGHLLRLSSEGVDDGHDVVEHLVFTRREMEHTEEENSKSTLSDTGLHNNRGKLGEK